MKNYPKCRDNNIVVQETANELMVYDLVTNKVHFLNKTSAEIWKSCDGKTSIPEIAKNQNIPEEYVIVALSDLWEANLMEGEIKPDIPSNKISRRKLLMKAGATAAVLPIILSLITPTSAQTQSCLTSDQTFNLNPSPFFADQPECANALIAEAQNICCAGFLNLTEFSSSPQLCRGRCGGA